MAIYPCSVAPHRYVGPQRSSYITLAEGATTMSRKLRLCPEHFVRHMAIVAEHLVSIDAETPINLRCMKCNSSRSTVVWVTLYDQGAEGASWAGDFCTPCAERVADQLDWDRAMER